MSLKELLQSGSDIVSFGLNNARMKPDYHQLRKLWADTFGDTESYLDVFFDTYYRSALILTEERSGSIISVLWGLPFNFSGGLKGLYLCGLATKPQYRGEGIMSRLMERAEEWAIRNDFDFLFLIPADEHLRRYYSERGYLDALSRTVWEIPEPETRKDLEEVSDRYDLFRLEDLEALQALQLSDLKPGLPRIIHQDRDWRAVLRESNISGGRIFCSRICDSDGTHKIDAVAFSERRDEESPLRIVRVLGGEAASEVLLASLRARVGHDEPYGMWKPISEAVRGIKAPDFFLLLD